MAKEQIYTVKIVAEGETEVYATSNKQAEKLVKEMFKSGDGCAELGNTTFKTTGKRDQEDDE